MSRDWGREAQEAAEARLDVLEEVQEAMCTGEDAPEHLPDQLAGPCCEGCQTCTVREVLDAAWPIMLAAAQSGDFNEVVAT